MKLLNIALGYRDFLSKSEIINNIEKSKNYKPDQESPDSSEALLIFKTSKQQTWIVCSTQRLYIMLDDVRKDRPSINKSISKNRLVANSQLSADIVEKDKSEKSGRLLIGDMPKGYLFTKSIFANDSIVNAVSTLITKQMT